MEPYSIRRYFPILSTTPYNPPLAPETTSTSRASPTTAVAESIVGTLGNERSFRSQFRTQQSSTFLNTTDCTAGTRVSVAAPGTLETSCQQGVNDGESFIPAQNHQHVRKCAFRRAIRKAQRGSAAMYRGKAMYANVSLPVPKPLSSPEGSGSRVKILSWNCDGLTTTLYAELMAWLRKHHEISILFLQETHWSRTMEWSADGWHFCHSASAKARSAGVLIGVRSSFVQPTSISWHEAVPGRLLQVRCFQGGQHVDLVCAYQHAMGFGNSGQLQKIYQRRRGFWSDLRKLLSSLPYRSHVVLGGDFNCSVDPQPKLVGHGVLAGPSTEAAKVDRRLFMDILQEQQLCILNTWSGRFATYQHPKGRSQIDFVAIRVPLADALAKSCQPTETLLAGWRSAGHKPLVASIRALWRPWHRSPAPTATVARHAAQALAFGSQPSLSQLHESLQSEQAPLVQRPRMPVRESSHALITGFWRLRRKVTQLRWADARGVFLAWRLSAQLLSKKRELDRHLRQTKRAQLLQVLQSAEDAAQRNLTGGFYKYVNLLCPKSQRQRVRLRSESGQLLDQKAECALLASYARKLFQGEPWELPQLLPISADLFSAAHWKTAFSVIPWNKTAPIFTPSINTWKGKAPAICGQLASIAAASLASQTPHIPSEWASVQIAWLPKPNKTPSSPANLRTIGLMSGDQKAMLHIVKTHITGPILTAMSSTPQYAYRCGASTLDAISRSAEHCQQVRRQLESQRTDLATKLAGRHSTKLCGGLMANLDLAKAFDTLTYPEMYRSLQEARIDEPLCRLIIHLHASTQCAILHGDHCATVPMSRGLRQGCPIAPIIFAAWSVRVCRIIDSQLGSGWSMRHLTLFSDDTHAYWKLHSPKDLEHAISQLSTVITVLTDAGMTVNFGKSSAVCVLKGQCSATAQSRHFRWRDGALHLRLPRDTTDMYIPLTDTLEYLGIVLSYHNFEIQTVKLRAAKAQINYSRLYKVLRVNGPLSEKQRLRVYIACVLSSWLYGLVGVGLSSSCYKILYSGVCGHLRKVLRVYQQGVSNAQVTARAGIDIAATLSCRAASLVASIAADSGRSAELKAPELHHSQSVVTNLEAALECTQSASLTRVIQDSSAIFDCPVCGQSFLGNHHLVMHINSKHPSLNQQSKIAFERHKHALHGIPRCRFCRVTLFSWQVLEQHLTCGMCPRLKDGFGRGLTLERIFEDVLERERTDPPEPPLGISPSSQTLLFDRPEHGQPLHSALREHSIIRLYSLECALCGQKLQSPGKTKTHWRYTHPAAWNLVESVVSGAARSLLATLRNPCPYCLSPAKDPKAHSVQCPALFQFLAVRHLHQRRCSVDQLQKEAGPGSRQSERRAAYLDFDPRQLPLARAFSASHAGSSAPQLKAPLPSLGPSATDSASRATAVTAAGQGQIPEMFERFQGARAGPTQALSTAESGSLTSDTWCMSIRLSNPHTQCYINAALLALGHINCIRNVSPSLADVFRVCQAHLPSTGSLHIAGHPALTMLTPGWYFGIRQQDASEYLEALLSLDFSVLWESRVFEEGVRICDSGIAISLDLSDRSAGLQDMLNAWSAQHFVHALHMASDLVCIQLGRYPHQIKNSRLVDLPDRVLLPVFSGDGNIELFWVAYQLQAVIVHLGRTPTSGHYRALLRVGGRWHYCNDRVPAVTTPMLDEHKRGCYVLLLLRSA